MARKSVVRAPEAPDPHAGRLDYRTERGWCSADIADVSATLPIAELLPSREPAVYVGQQNMPGWYFSHTMGRRLRYESVNERTNLLTLDLDPAVTAIAVQPFRLWLSGTTHRYPDVLVERRDGSRSLIEVTLTRRLDSKRRREGFDQEAAICKKVGWGFQVVTELDFDPQETLNRQWIASFRRGSSFDPDIADCLIRVCREAKPIYEILSEVDLDEDDARPVLFHLVAVGQLRAEMRMPLTNQTMIGPVTWSDNPGYAETAAATNRREGGMGA